MKLNLFSKPSIVGIDIQPEKLRLIELTHHKTHYSIEYAASRELPTDLFHDGKIKHWDSLRTIITELVVEAKLGKKVTAICLPSNLVRMQHFEVPLHLTEIQLMMEVKARLMHELPGLTEELTIDFRLCPSDIPNYAAVFFAVARKEYLSQFVECVREANLQLKMVDIDVCALLRTVLYSSKSDVRNKNSFVIVYVLRKRITLLFCKNDGIYAYQNWDINYTSDQFTQKINLFLTGSSNIKPEALLLCGESIIISELQNNLINVLAIPVQTIDVFSICKFAQAKFAELIKKEFAAFLIPFGLAMREMPKW